jgi:hypothetical protein
MFFMMETTQSALQKWLRVSLAGRKLHQSFFLSHRATHGEGALVVAPTKYILTLTAVYEHITQDADQ